MEVNRSFKSDRRYMVGRGGFEPPTNWLKARQSVFADFQINNLPDARCIVCHQEVQRSTTKWHKSATENRYRTVGDSDDTFIGGN
jgi:hypothetical protein